MGRETCVLPDRARNPVADTPAFLLFGGAADGRQFTTLHPRRAAEKQGVSERAHLPAGNPYQGSPMKNTKCSMLDDFLLHLLCIFAANPFFNFTPLRQLRLSLLLLCPMLAV